MALLRPTRPIRPVPFVVRLRLARVRAWLGHKRALRRGALLIVALMLLSIVLGARSTISAAEDEWGTTVAVLVVAEPVGIGETLAGKVRVDDLPAALIPDDVAAPDVGMNERAVRSLLPGDIVTERDLQSAERSMLLADGQRAFSLPKGPAMPELFVGDRVELVLVADALDGSVPASTAPATVIDSAEDTVTLSIDHEAIVDVVSAVAADRVIVVRS